MSQKLIQAGTSSKSLDTGSPVTGQNMESPVCDSTLIAIKAPLTGSILTVEQAKREFTGKNAFLNDSPSQ